MSSHFNESEITKKVFDDRWVRFAFGPQGHRDPGGFNLGIVEFDKDIQSLAHSHDVSEALYVLEGQGKVFLGQKETSLKKGDFLFIPQGTEHRLLAGSRKLKILFVFSAKTLIDY
jgi:quercetin dioxygenase-like cupin family protein